MTERISLFQRHITNLESTGSEGEWLGNCPYPACKGKKTRKFYVNERTGQFKCHHCGISGNGISFARSFGEDHSAYCDLPLIQTRIDPQKVAQYHQDLLGRPEKLRKPWRRGVLELLQVGWDERKQTLTFPIFDSTGQIVNFIFHKSYQLKGAKVTLYPAHLLEEFDPLYIVICEGLVDCISLLSIGVQAVTSSGGALSMPKDVSILRRFRRVYLCFDVDEAGESGCEKWINRLLSEMNA